MASDREFFHVPVLLKECLDALAIRPDGIYADGTTGGAGHSSEIARRLTTGHLYCFDKDTVALEAAQQRLKPYRDRVTLIHRDFVGLADELRRRQAPPLNGVLFDLGVSSAQLDDGQRGFSYRADAPLDMRMDRTAALTAREVVNTYSQEELRRIFFTYGEERYAPLIAAAIVRRREQAPIETTLELAELIRAAVPAKALREKQHPARRVFQALRIEVNGELTGLAPALEGAMAALAPGGRLAVITFHSLEDRIVKETMKQWEVGCTCPPDFPVCVCGKTALARRVNRKPIVPTQQEVSDNFRAHSAKLRVAERQ